MKKLAFFLLLLLSANLFGQTEKRLALVVGNSAYGEGQTLNNPVHDAEDISTKLQQLGFDVTTLYNGTRRDMHNAISSFAEQAKTYDVALFYYSGHGFQTSGENYLMPVDAVLEKEVDIEFECTPMNLLLKKLDISGCPMKIIVLDACRNNPFERSWHRSASSSGLSFVDAPSGTLISYATSPGKTANDGNGRNSPYTKAFLDVLDMPGKNVLDFFNEVGTKVQTSTNHKQTPWVTNSAINGSFCFNREKPTVANNASISRMILLAKTAESVIPKDSYLAQRIMLEALPSDLKNPERPYTTEAERVLRHAIYQNNICIIDNPINRISSISFSPNGKRFLLTSNYSPKTIKVFETETGTLLFSKEFIDMNEGTLIEDAAFSPDGNTIYIPSSGKIMVLDAEKGEILPSIVNYGTSTSLSFSQDGEYFLTSTEFYLGYKNIINVFQTRTNELVERIEHSNHFITAFFSPDSKQIITTCGALEHAFRIWDAQTGENIRTVELDDDGVVSAIFSPDGKHIAYIEKSLQIMDLETGEFEKLCEKQKQYFHAIAYSPDGKFIAAAYNNKIYVWNVKSKKIVQTLTGNTNNMMHVCFSPDGKRILSASNFEIMLWNFEETSRYRTIEADPNSSRFRTIAIDPKGELLASGTKNSIKLWNARTLDTVNELKDSGTTVLSFSPDGKHLISSSQDKKLKLWDLPNGQLNKSFGEQAAYFSSVSFSPNGNLLVSTSYDKYVIVWDIKTKKEILKEKLYASQAIFNSEGDYIIAAQQDTIIIWGLQNHDVFKLYGPQFINSIAICPNSDKLVSTSGDHSIWVWDLSSLTKLKTINGHDESIHSASFSPDGRYIISTSADQKIKIWDANTYQEVQTLTNSHAPFKLAFFSPDGRSIIASSEDERTICVWDFLPLQELIDQTRERFKNYPLTPEERTMYHLE